MIYFVIQKGGEKMERSLTLKGHRLKLLYKKEEIEEAIKRLAREIYETYHLYLTEKNFLLKIIVILEGGRWFGTILSLELSKLFPVGTTAHDSISISSYRDGTSPTEIQILKDTKKPISGQHVVIVDDIADTAGTLARLLKILKARNPASLRTCVLIDKTPRREKEIPLDFVGFKLPKPLFLIGFGLDWAEAGRELEDIYYVEGLR